MPTDEIQYFNGSGAYQEPLLQDFFNHHPCWVKDDTLYNTVYHTSSGLELGLQYSLPIWSGCIGLCVT